MKTYTCRCGARAESSANQTSTIADETGMTPMLTTGCAFVWFCASCVSEVKKHARAIVRITGRNDLLFWTLIAKEIRAREAALDVVRELTSRGFDAGFRGNESHEVEIVSLPNEHHENAPELVGLCSRSLGRNIDLTIDQSNR